MTRRNAKQNKRRKLKSYNDQNKQRVNDYNNLLSRLREMDVEEMLLLYIEAKTGSQDDIDRLPVRITDAINELGEMLKTFYADRLIKNL